MHPRIIVASVACILLASTIVLAQQTRRLINADVVEMTKAGLPQSTIILAIQKGPSEFDTSAQALIQLKNSGVTPAVLDAMIQAGATPAPSNHPTGSAAQVNPVNPLMTTTVTVPASDGVFLLDGPQRRSMKYSRPESRSNSGLGAFVNPLHKTRIRLTLNGERSDLRIKNSAPIFEVSIAADAKASDLVTVVRLKPKSERREIEVFRGSITGVSSGFRKEDQLSVELEEIPGSTSSVYKLYRVKLITPLTPGEYALVYAGHAYYDFGLEANQ